jgi:capsular polysaccharide transport system permease protein
MTDAPDREQRRLDALRQADLAEAQLSRNPRDLHPLLVAADQCRKAAEPNRAAALLDRVIAGAPAAFPSRLSLSSQLAALGRHADALVWARRALELRPGDARAWLHLTGLFLSLQRPRDALAAAESHLLHATAPSPRGHHLLSVARAAMGDFAGAILASGEAVSLAPDVIEYRRHLASTLGNAGRLEAAIAACDEALARAPGDAMAWRVRSGIHELIGDDAAALADAEHAMALAPDNAGIAAHLRALRRSLAVDGAAMPQDAPPRGRPRPVRQPPARQDFLAALAARGRTIHAILLHEVRTRHARSRLGYIWALLEPVGHLATLGSIFYLLSQGPAPVGESLFVFYITGLLPYLAFSHTASAVAEARSAGGSLLQLPVVGPLDVPAARAALQLVTEILVALLVLAGVALLLNETTMPADLSTTAAGLLCLWLIGCGAGLVGLVLSHMVPAWDYLWGAVVRLLYFGSGIYYSPIVFPGPVLEMLSWNPILQGIEWGRAGFFAGYDPPWLDRGYALGFSACLLFVGLALERAARQRLQRIQA